jgi:YHS domain-containing protein
MKRNIAIILIAATFGCNQPGNEHKEMKMGTKTAAQDTVKNSLDNLAFAEKKDLVCGMPVTAGVADTAYYKGKLYGFCAKECKDEFEKNPQQYLTSKN